MSTSITSVSKHAEPLNRAAAAIHVITADDVRRSGYTNLAEALRMVPGVQVARTRSSGWSIGVRGFNSGLSNKLLVLIDGRSVYSPLFAGVFWELQHVSLDDLERIEVIRGPGGTLWGANAVNGVINIITRSARSTHGVSGYAGGGTEERGFGSLSVGGELSPGLSLRGHASYFERDGQSSRTAADDPWRIGHLQARADWELDPDQSLTLLGGFFAGEVRDEATLPLLAPPFSLPVERDDHKRGGHLLGRFTRRLGKSSELNLHVYWDRTDLEFPTVREQRDTWDVDLQHVLPLGERHLVTWGLGYRGTRDELDQEVSVLRSSSRAVHTWTGFLQDRFALIPDELDVTLGTKLEYNELSGFEYQPSGRFSWTPHLEHSFWGAVSRAVRTPTRLDEDARLALATLAPGAPGNPSATQPAQFIFFGSKDFESEEIIAFEAGYRTGAVPGVKLDVAAFYNLYDDLLTAPFAAPFAQTNPVGHVVLPLVAANQLKGESYGVEVTGWWQPLPWWRVHGWYAYLDVNLEIDGGSSDTTSEAQEDQIPNHQAFLRNSFDLPWRFEFDAILRFVDDLPGFGIADSIDLDARLAWHANAHWEISLVGQNLLEDRRGERSGPTATQVQRGVYGQIRWHY